jgi:hypothetical protein
VRRKKTKNLQFEHICHAFVQYESGLVDMLNGWQLKFTRTVLLMCLLLHFFRFLFFNNMWNLFKYQSSQFITKDFLIEKRLWCSIAFPIRFLSVLEMNQIQLTDGASWLSYKARFSYKDKFLYVMCVLVIWVTQFFCCWIMKATTINEIN